jgi:RNA polymerase sigma-70 factor (ECF subfamily)
MHSDEHLMAAYAAGDSQAFRELFSRYHPVLLRLLAYNLQRPEEAHDLVQLTFLQLHRARLDYNPTQPFRPWAVTIALNLKREYLRRGRRRPETSLESQTEAIPTVPGHDQSMETHQAIHRGLREITAEQREVIELHWFGGLSFTEIANVVGARVSAVKVRAHRGYLALRQYLTIDEEPNSALSAKER